MFVIPISCATFSCNAQTGVAVKELFLLHTPMIELQRELYIRSLKHVVTRASTEQLRRPRRMRAFCRSKTQFLTALRLNQKPCPDICFRYYLSCSSRCLYDLLPR